MKFLRLLAAAAPLLAAGLWAAETPANGIVTPESLFPQLDVILKQAVAQSPRMIGKAVEEEIAENDRIGARAGLLPSVGGYYNINEARDKRGDLPERIHVQKQYYDFRITQPIFHWGERRNNDRIGAIRLAMSKNQYAEAYRLLAQEIRGSYLRLIGDKWRFKRAVLANSYYQSVLKKGEDRLAKKVISEAQIFNIRLDAERSQIIEERTRFDFETNKVSFARLTGMPVLTDDQIPDSIPVIPPQDAALQDLLAGFLSQKDNPPAYDAEVMRRQLQVERLNLANTTTRLRPKFSLVAGITQDEQSYTLNIAQKYSVNSYFGGVSINWSIFDGFASGAAERNVRARIRQMERDYVALTERVAQAAQNQFKAIGFTGRFGSINDRVLESTEGYIKTRREEFARGVISEDDVTSAELGLIDTRINALTSRADYLTQVAEFLGTVVHDPVLANVPKL